MLVAGETLPLSCAVYCIIFCVPSLWMRSHVFNTLTGLFPDVNINCIRTTETTHLKYGMHLYVHCFCGLAELHVVCCVTSFNGTLSYLASIYWPPIK